MKNWGSTLPKILLAVAAVSISAVATAGEPVGENAGAGHFAVPDRNMLQALNRAKKLLKEQHYGEALEGLSQVLRGSEDYFYQPDRKLSVYKSLKAEARQLLAEMPREARDLYEVRNGAEAREKLNRAVAAGDAAGLAEVSGQWFCTRAGYESTYLLALHHMDHGMPLAGALTLRRLREAGPAETFEPGLSLTQAACYFQAGMPGECRQVLAELKRRLGPPSSKKAARLPGGVLGAPACGSRVSLRVAGREIPWFEQEGEAPAWLAKLTGLQPMVAAPETDRWAMFRGGPSRNASIVGGAPLLDRCWRAPVTDDPILEEALRRQQALRREQGSAVFSALHPLAIGDVVLMRTASSVLAIDLHTGKQLWQTKPEGSVGPPLSRARRGFMRQNMGLPARYGQRIWDDAAYGTFSSDGRLVFVVEELPLGVTAQYGGFVPLGGMRIDLLGPGISNRLAAYDIHNGEPRWEFDGRATHGRSGIFFLGPPLPLRGQLYVMAEIKDEVRLLVLDGATGAIRWSQPLAMLDANVMQDPVRRLAGVSPSYGDGVLICPTGAGCMVAIDLATHSLLWGHVYSGPDEAERGRGLPPSAVRNPFMISDVSLVPRWLDSAAMIVNGRVLTTPPEADWLYCLNLADGKPAWAPQPRGERYYIACVHQGVVVLVGRNSIEAINLEDGSKAWGGLTIATPSGADVCGHGCYAQGSRHTECACYYVPLSSGEVMSVDLESGKVLAIVKSRCSAPPGNLVCHRGRMISQGLDGLELYYQIDAARDEAARRLAVNADDVEALTLRGEVFLDSGKPAEAVADFRRAYSLEKNSAVPPKGGTTSANGRSRELLRDALLAGLRDDFAANRAMAGEIEPLLDDGEQRATYLRTMATGLHRAGQWGQAVEYYLKLVDLEAKPPLEKVDRSHLVRRDRWVQARLGMLRSEGGPAAAAVIDRVLKPRLEEARKDTSIEGLKRFLAFFGSQPQASAARVELLERLARTGRILEAELLMAAAVDPADRKAQAGLLADIAALDFRAGRRPWVHGARDAAVCFRQLQQEFAGVPCHAGMTSSQWLAVFPHGDALRRELDRLLPVWPVGEVEVSKPVTSSTWATDIRGARFDSPLGGHSGPFFTDYTVSNSDVTPELSANPFGPVNARYVCFQRKRDVVAVDPLSGEPLWVRQDVPPGSEVFGDEQYVFVLPTGSDEVSVYRAIDGQLLGTRKVPRPKPDANPDSVPWANSRLCNSGIDFRGRFVLTWQHRGDDTDTGSVLTVFDPWLQQAIWPPRKFDSGARVSVVGSEAVGVLEPGGHFVLVALADGRTLADLQLEVRPHFSLTDLLVTRMGDQYIVLAHDNRAPGNVNQERGIRPAGMLCFPVRRGRVHALDLQGKLAWPAPVDVDRRQFFLDQPGRLPVLLFFDLHYGDFVGQFGRLTLQTSLLAVDRRNGRIVYERDSCGPVGPMAVEIDGDPAEKTVQIAAGSETVRLTFTDKPIKTTVRRSGGVE